MFKLTKAILNNINNKNYKKNRDSLELYDLSAVNRVPLEKRSSEFIKIHALEDEWRHDNLEIYMKSMAKLRAKQAVTIATPILLGTLTIASFVNGKYIKTETVDTVYHNTVEEFNEEILFQNIDMYYTTFLVDRNYARPNVVNGSIDRSSYAQIYYGSGSSAIQVKFDINDDNTWQYDSHTNYLYDKDSNPPEWEVSKIDEKYKELINEATETFIRQAELSEEEIAFLRELVSNNENDIIVKIKKCETLSDVPLEINSFHWIRCALLIIADIVLAIIFIKNWDVWNEARRVEARGYYLEEGHNTVFYNMFTAALEYRKAFLLAENNRITTINSILTEYGGSDEILSKYEKSLIRKNETKIETKK